jgi:hypothetical protein
VKNCEEVSYKKDGSTFVGLQTSSIKTDTEWLIKESFSLKRIKKKTKKTIDDFLCTTLRIQ